MFGNPNGTVHCGSFIMVPFFIARASSLNSWGWRFPAGHGDVRQGYPAIHGLWTAYFMGNPIEMDDKWGTEISGNLHVGAGSAQELPRKAFFWTWSQEWISSRQVYNASEQGPLNDLEPDVLQAGQPQETTCLINCICSNFPRFQRASISILGLKHGSPFTPALHGTLRQQFAHNSTTDTVCWQPVALCLSLVSYTSPSIPIVDCRPTMLVHWSVSQDATTI